MDAEIRQELWETINLKLTNMAGLVTHLRWLFNHIAFSIKAQFLMVPTRQIVLLQMLPQSRPQMLIIHIKTS